MDVTPARSARSKDRTYGADQAVYLVIDRFRGLGTVDRETGMRVEIPMLAPLEATIEAGPTGDLAYLVTRRGTPFKKGALGTAFGEAARAAAVRGKSAHGPRKAAATRAAENGQPSGNWRPILAGPGGGSRRSTPRAPTAAGLRRGPSAS